jgi:predicted metal-dependent hydrolase
LSELPRYLPEQAWPAYAYRPGRDPHPTRDPGGHSRGVPDNHEPAEQPADWSASARYLRGIDLYNHGYGWEAHEVWESMWHRPAEAAQAQWLQTLIQLAAATVQERIGHPDGRVRLCQRAMDHLRRVREEGHRVYMGLELEQLRHALQAYADDPARRPILHLK